MTDRSDSLDGFERRISELELSISQADAITAAFRDEMEEVSVSMRNATQNATTLSRSVGTQLKNAFTDLIFDGARATDVLRDVGKSLTGSVLNSALKPVANAIGGAITGGLFGGAFAKGGVISKGRVEAFASGGIVSSPTTFPMSRGRTGLMGEAGPEAIMPLARGADGRLGVRGAGGQAINVTMNIETPDVAGFQRARGQVAAQVSRALARSKRNM
ncbi:MAG: phage tail tape measure protein [Pseudomonadota bacterium]